MLQTNLRVDYKMALELTSGILILELIHRIFVCVFEVMNFHYLSLLYHSIRMKNTIFIFPTGILASTWEKRPRGWCYSGQIDNASESRLVQKCHNGRSSRRRIGPSSSRYRLGLTTGTRTIRTEESDPSVLLSHLLCTMFLQIQPNWLRFGLQFHRRRGDVQEWQ